MCTAAPGSASLLGGVCQLAALKRTQPGRPGRMRRMPDPVATGELVFAAAAVKRIFGPAAAELGQAFGRATQSRMRNFGRVTEKAAALLGDAADGSGSVSLRLADKVINDGSWCDDPLMQDYLAGLLVSSRNDDGSDDTGVYWSSVVTRLAAKHVKLHYLVYRALKDRGGEPGASLNTIEGQRSRSIFLPFSGLSGSLGLPVEQVHQSVSSSMYVLAKEQLIGPEWGTGAPHILQLANAPSPGLQAVPTHAGLDLFGWAHGQPIGNFDALLTPGFPWNELEDAPPPVKGAIVGPLLS